MDKKPLLILVHIIGWILCFSLILAFIQSGSFGGQTLQKRLFSWPFLLFAGFYVSLFYLNLCILLPRFFVRKKYITYSFILLALLTLTFYLKPFDVLLNASRPDRQEVLRQPPPPPAGTDVQAQRPPPPGNRPGFREGHFDLMSIILFLTVAAVSTIIVINRQWRITERHRAMIQVDKARAELSFLKAQVSPHFLFNTLNNIYALAIGKSAYTASSILRLSNIMRYITDDAHEQFVPVEKEISCINDFIELQKLRLSKKVQVQYELSGRYESVAVAPLILMPFIENVFKHGISNNTPAAIIIRIGVTNEQVHLFTENNIIDHNKETPRQGIGLENVTQRLELLYPGSYELILKRENGTFIADLRLQTETKRS
ncbi:sensor histidine kinase [Niabella beijingensis]|uniref:sensor histidine kinase n=1 Tax=Niabella beijingensis TaxID=2872700 RepID=UPI001CC0B69A|nr:histidine kinase [Niabella beijingensis]MBZ4191428.1 histidine kinase [Niabella beijingensis]